MNNKTDKEERSQTDREQAVELQRKAHWPYAAGYAQRHFDLYRIEQQAERILARGLRSKRLVAFVGAGASMAYGRLTWGELMGGLYRALEQAFKSLGPVNEPWRLEWDRTNQLLWKRQISNFRKADENNNHMVRAQILANIVEWAERARPAKMRSSLHHVTSHLLKSHHGFVDVLLQRLSNDATEPAGSDKGLPWRQSDAWRPQI